MAFILLIGIILLFAVSYKFIDKDFLSPVNLYLLFSIVSIAAMFLLYYEWNISEYGAFATVVYLIGSVSFVVGCAIAKLASMRNVIERSKIPGNVEAANRIEMSAFKIIVMIGVSFISLYGTYASMKRAGSITSILAIGQAISRYRYLRSQGLLIGEDAKSAIWNLFSYMSIAFAYCSIFVFIKNAVNRKFKIKDLLLLIPFIFRSFEYLLQSNRGGIIQMFFGAVISWFISMKFRGGWGKKINSKAVKIAFRAAVILLPIFFGSLIFLGRYDTLRGFDFKNYSLIYLSGGVRNLDQYMKNPTGASEIFGEETFVLMHRNLFIRSGIGKNLVRYLEFRSINGMNIGNIYTSFRRFYHDFGLLGVCVLSLVQGLIISALYYKINRNPSKDKINFLEVVYCYLSYTTIYVAIDDLFYSSWVSITGIKILIIMFAVYFFMFNITSKRLGVISIDFGRLRFTSKTR